MSLTKSGASDREDTISTHIEGLKDRRFDLDEDLADVTSRLRELSHMEQEVARQLNPPK